MKNSITRKIEIDMGHRIPNHKSKCRNIHGHRYIFEACVSGKNVRVKGASDEGMIIDFSDLKEAMMKEIHERLDHGFMMYDNDPFAPQFRKFHSQKIIFVPFVPTAENIAKYTYGLLKPKLASKKMKLENITVWETPNSSASYND